MDYLNVEIVEKRLERNREERKLLEGLLADLKLLQKFDGAEQLPLATGLQTASRLPTANRMKGKISFPNGLRQVLQRVDGKPMKAAEIWKQMEALGVVSNAKKPESFISLIARKEPNVEAMGENTFRWTGD